MFSCERIHRKSDVSCVSSQENVAGLDGHHTVDLYCGDHESLWWEEGGMVERGRQGEVGEGRMEGVEERRERWGEGGRSEKGEVIK